MSDRLPHRSILLVGGCGYVGRLIAHAIRVNDRWDAFPCFGFSVFDKNPGTDKPWGPYGVVTGDATNFGDLYFAAKGIDTLVYMAEGDVDRPETLFSATVHGFYNALKVAQAQSVRRVILLSSLSVHSPRTGDLTGVRDFSEDTPPQCDHPDGITRLIAELQGEHFAKTFGLSVIVLRLSGPMSDAKLLADRERCIGKGPVYFGTGASDVTDAIVRAAFVEDVQFEVINICGDLTGELVDTSKAERILGWRPTV